MHVRILFYLETPRAFFLFILTASVLLSAIVTVFVVYDL